MPIQLRESNVLGGKPEFVFRQVVPDDELAGFYFEGGLATASAEVKSALNVFHLLIMKLGVSGEKLVTGWKVAVGELDKVKCSISKMVQTTSGDTVIFDASHVPQAMLEQYQVSGLLEEGRRMGVFSDDDQEMELKIMTKLTEFFKESK